MYVNTVLYIVGTGGWKSDDLLFPTWLNLLQKTEIKNMLWCNFLFPLMCISNTVFVQWRVRIMLSETAQTGAVKACDCLKWLKQLTQWKKVNTWRPLKQERSHLCMISQQCSFCTVYNKWLSPSMGYLGKNEHLEPIFGIVIILSGLSR